MDRFIDAFDKNPLEEVRVSIEEYRGYQLFGIRVWTENKAGEKVPTKKGITLQIEQFPRFKEAVERLASVLTEAGLLDPEDL